MKISAGVRSSEFWVTAFTVLGTAAGIAAGVITGPFAVAAAGIATGAYAISRAIVKAKQGDIKGAASEAKTVVDAAKAIQGTQVK